MSNYADETKSCTAFPGFVQKACHRLKQVWQEGDTELYFSGYAWHNRYKYSAERIKTYNEKAWGGGLGKGFVDEDGDWHGLVAIAFLDSHKNVEPAAGYAFLKQARFSSGLQVGAGYTALLTMRPDILNGYPFPGVLPLLSVRYNKVALFATYIPGARDAGNVLFIFGKWTFEKL